MFNQRERSSRIERTYFYNTYANEKKRQNDKKSMIFNYKVYENEHFMFNKNTGNPTTFIFVVGPLRACYSKSPSTKSQINHNGQIESAKREVFE